MTDNDKELVEVMKDAVFYGTGFMKDGKHIPIEDVYLDPRNATIEAQAAEIERLRKALEQIRDMDVDRSSEAWKRHSMKLQNIAREALENENG
jgi:hypothetical protein